ncbi:MAG: hypothetical protein D6698_07785 [Gammaproteobacteria bacterium]|nr:MAG: hypothetical protein D6698_07785 [Gammaproteobacteria bacterium]
MIQWFDDKVFKSKFLLIFIMALIALPLVMWRLAGEFEGGASGPIAVKVNGQPVYSNEYQNTVAQVRERLKPLADVNPKMVTDELVEKQAMDEVIMRTLFEQFAKEQGMRLSNEQVAEQIATMRQFLKDGSFDQNRYEAVLHNAQLTPAQFEERVRKLGAIDQLQNSLQNSEFVLPEELNRMAGLMGEKRDAGLIRIPVDRFEQKDGFGDDEIEKYYNEHQQQFKTPERARFEYLELSREKLAEQVKVDEEAIRQAYENRKDEFMSNPEWHARHILIEVGQDASEAEKKAAKDKATSLYEALQKGASFEELAKSSSDDPVSAKQGGDLGFFGKGDMVPPFEEAVSKLNINEISEPVRTRFGYHIIQLLEKKVAQIQPLEKVHDRLRDELIQAETENLFFDRQEVLGNLTFENPGTLDPASEALGIPIQTSDWVSRQNAGGLFSNPKVLEAAFSDEVIQDGNNSQVIELNADHLLVVRLKDYQAEQTQPLDKVKEQVIQALAKEKAAKDAENLGQLLIKGIQNGEEAAALAEKNDLKWEKLTDIERHANDLGRSVSNTLFALHPVKDAKATVTGVMNDVGSEYVVIQLLAIHPGKRDDDILASLRERLIGSLGRAELEAIATSLKDSAEISRPESP